MHTLKFNKKILLLLLYFLILSNNTVAGEYIAELKDQIQFPIFTVFDSKEKPIILKLNDGSIVPIFNLHIHNKKLHEYYSFR